MSGSFRPSPRPRPISAREPSAAHPVEGSDAEALERYESLREAIGRGPGVDALPAPMLDGYLCGVLLQPAAIPVSRWWPAVVDPDDPVAAGGARSPALDAMREVAIARHAELDAAIRARRWFDPWVIEVGGDDLSGDPSDDSGRDRASRRDRPDPDLEPVDALAMPGEIRDAVYPWVAGFAHAMATFQDLLELTDPAAAEPQALICQFLDPDELEDAEALFELIESFEPPLELSDAVEALVRATLLLADLTRPERPVNRAGRRRS
jgi:uncharacterized protein